MKLRGPEKGVVIILIVFVTAFLILYIPYSRYGNPFGMTMEGIYIITLTFALMLSAMMEAYAVALQYDMQKGSLRRARAQ